MNRFKIVSREVINPTNKQKCLVLFVIDKVSNKEFKCINKDLSDEFIIKNYKKCVDSVVFKETEYGVRALITFRPGLKYKDYEQLA